MINKRYSSIKGFTLMDILISAAIVSLLSSVVLFNVSEGKVKAEDSKMKTESAQVATAIELYKNDHGGKTPIANLTSSGSLPSGAETGEMYEEGSDEYIEVMDILVASGYISAIPKSPDGSSYAYGESNDGSEFFFTAKLKHRNNPSTYNQMCTTANWDYMYDLWNNNRNAYDQLSLSCSPFLTANPNLTSTPPELIDGEQADIPFIGQTCQEITCQYSIWLLVPQSLVPLW